MTLICDLDLELAWLTWVLHIDSLMQTFDQSLMNIFKAFRRNGVEGQTDRADGQMDRHRWTDKGHFYNPQSASPRGTQNSRLKPVTLN